MNKLISGVFTGVAAVWLIGCASSETRLSRPVGPRPGAKLSEQSSGTLQVLSAPQKIDPDVNFEEFFAGEGTLRQFDEPAHTDYSLYSADGKFIRRVQNARDPQDPEPTRLPLAPGRYGIEAEAEGSDGLRTTVYVPVLIQAGQTTRVHLAGSWHPRQSKEGGLVYLPGGQAVGWGAVLSENPIQH